MPTINALPTVTSSELPFFDEFVAPVVVANQTKKIKLLFGLFHYSLILYRQRNGTTQTNQILYFKDYFLDFFEQQTEK